MNIARELGSLISGLLAPQKSSPVQRSERGSTNRSRTTNRDQAGNPKTAGTPQGSDRITLSSASISLANSAQEQAAPDTAITTATPIQSGELLALPYSPAATIAPRQQTSDESPATRQLVRALYGSSEASSTTTTPDTASRINLHA
jgi:hypothetical protein